MHSPAAGGAPCAYTPRVPARPGPTPTLTPPHPTLRCCTGAPHAPPHAPTPCAGQTRYAVHIYHPLFFRTNSMVRKKKHGLITTRWVGFVAFPAPPQPRPVERGRGAANEIGLPAGRTRLSRPSLVNERVTLYNVDDKGNKTGGRGDKQERDGDAANPRTRLSRPSLVNERESLCLASCVLPGLDPPRPGLRAQHAHVQHPLRQRRQPLRQYNHPRRRGCVRAEA